MQMIERRADARTRRKRGVRSYDRLHWRVGSVCLLVFATFLFLTQTTFAGGFALSGVGSKAIGMGGAFRGLADDWSAAYWNPAGLTQIEGSELNAMLVAITPRPEYTPNILYDGLEVGYRNGQTRYPNDRTNFIPDFSGFIKLNEVAGMTAGLAIFVPFGLGSEWDLFNPAGMDLARQFPLYDHQADLQVIDFHPTVAKSFMEGKFSLGAGLSIQRGDVTFRKTYLKPSGLPVPHQNLIIDSEINGDGWGFGANFGLLYELSEKLQFGISGKTGSTLKLEGIADQELYTFNNEDLRTILLQNSFTAAETTQVLFLFAADNHKASPNAKADIKTPADVGFGLAVKPSEKLTITGEVAYTLWSSLDSILIELDGPDPSGAAAQNTAIVLDWDNTLRYSFGAEYWVSNPFAIRLGYYLDPSPVPNETFTPLIPDMGDKSSINIGAALKTSGIELSYNFEYIKFQERQISSPPSDVNRDGVYDNYPGTFKSDLYASHISLTYRF
jgi:long-chain fatty acid transport protein